MSVYVGVEGETNRPKDLVFPQDFTQDIVSVIDSSTGEIIGTDPAKGETYYSGSTIFFPPERVGNRDAQFIISNYDLDHNKKITKISFDLTSFPIDKYTNKTPTISVLTQLTEVVSLPITSLPLHVDGVVDLRDDDEGYITVKAGDRDGGKDIEDSYRATIDNLKVEVTGVNETVKAGVARKVTKIYTGVDNVARKVKKGYIGVGGVARPFFSAEGLEYYGTITPLSLVKESLAATTVGNYAIFAGGKESNVTTDAMDYYTNSLVKGTGDLRDAKSDLAATTVGNYAIFAGGYVNPPDQGWGSSYSVDTYDSSLTRRTGTVLSQRRSFLAATTVGNHALFGGGDDSVDAYNTSLTRNTLTALSVARRYLAATTVGDYAIFAGGNEIGSSYKDAVDAYDISLTRSTPTVLSSARNQLAATTVGNYALFGGGYGSSYKNTVDAYDTSLTRSTPTVLSAARNQLAATTVGNYAIFAGGYVGGSKYKDTVDAYNISLTRSTPKVLSVARRRLAATTVGNYALFGGGYGSSYKDTVDAYYQEGADRIKATVRISSNRLPDYMHISLQDDITGESFSFQNNEFQEITLIKGHGYSVYFVYTTRAGDPTTASIEDCHFELYDGNTITQYRGFVSWKDDTFYINPKATFGNGDLKLYITVNG